MNKDNEWTILNKSHLSEFKKDTGIIILQNEQITKQLLYIRDELTKIKKELKHLDDKYKNISNSICNINPFYLSRMQNTWLRLSRFNINAQDSIDTQESIDTHESINISESSISQDSL